MSKHCFEAAYPFNGARAAVVKSGGRFGIIGVSGELIVPPKFRSFDLYAPTVGQHVVKFHEPDSLFDLKAAAFVHAVGEQDPYIEPIDYFVVKENGRFGIQVLTGSYGKQMVETVAAVFDSVIVKKRSYFIASRNGKYGISYYEGSELLPFEYDSISVPAVEWYNIKTVGLKKGNVWSYYDLADRPRLVAESEFGCKIICPVGIKNAIGIFRDNRKFGILLRDGSTLAQRYDWISDNAAVAIEAGKLYLIREDGTPFLYYTLPKTK